MAERSLEIVFLGNPKPLQHAMQQVQDSSGNLTAKISGLSGAFKGVATVAAGFVLGGALTKLPGLASGAMNAASDLAESMSKVSVVFAEGAPEVERWAATAAKAMGQSKAQALEAAGTFGNFLQAMGQTPAVAKDMSLAMVGLATDLASFNNADPTEVILALRAGLSGEAEPMKKFGVALSEAAVSAKAVELGISKTGKEMTEQQKISARYAIIMEQTASAQGDFARTADGAANKGRILNARLADVSATIGQKLLPAKVALLGLLLDKGIPAFESLWQVVEKVERPLARVAEIAKGFGVGAFEGLKDLAGFAWDTISGPLETIAGLGERLGKAAFEGLKDLGGEVLAKLKDFASFVQETVIPVLKDLGGDALTKLLAVRDAVNDLASAKWADLSGHTSNLQASFKALTWGDVAAGFDKVMEKIQPAIDLLRPLVDLLVDRLKVAWSDIQVELQKVYVELGPLIDAFAKLEPILKPLGIVIGVVIVGVLAALLLALVGVAEIIKFTLIVALELLRGAIMLVTGVIEVLAWTVGTAIPAVIGFFKDLWEKGNEFIGKVKDLFTGLVSEIASAAGWVDHYLGIAGGYFETFWTNAKVPIDKLMQLLDDLIGKIKSIPSPGDIAGGVGGVVGKINPFAHGTSFAPGGLALVGEEGPELINLRRGSQVFTAGQTAAMLGGGQRTVTLSPTFNFYGPTNVADTKRTFSEWWEEVKAREFGSDALNWGVAGA